MKHQNDKPPLLKTWKHWYILVVVFLLLLISVFYLITKTFS